MRKSREFPAGTAITMADGCVRGPEDGLPWDADRTIPTGMSLGYAYQGWLAVKWDDEADPNFCKVSCLRRQFAKRTPAR